MSRVQETAACRGVLLLHGVQLHPLLMRALAKDLERQGHQPVLNWGYAPVPPGIDEVAERIAHRLQARFPEGVPQLDAVGHSMGGLILRKLLERGSLPEGGRMVFLGTPHAGAGKAEYFASHPLLGWLYRLLFRQSGNDLLPGSDFLRDLPPLPETGEFLAIQSGRGTKRGRSRLNQGDDDGTVERCSAEIEGARNLFVPHVHHLRLPVARRIRAEVCAFLRGETAVVSNSIRP